MISVVESAYGSVLYLEVKVAVPHISGGSTSDSGGEVGDMTLVVVQYSCTPCIEAKMFVVGGVSRQLRAWSVRNAVIPTTQGSHP